MIVRPVGLVRSGELQLGLEVEIEGGVVTAIRPHTGAPEPFVLSTAFVNAHSHLEYRGQQGAIAAAGYWDWLVELTRTKRTQTVGEVRTWALLAAKENMETGVAAIGEHSDRPVSGEAMAEYRIAGTIFQEVLTVGEADPKAKVEAVREAAAANASAFGGPVVLNPHAYWTVDEATLRSFGAGPLSIHVAESELERECYVNGTGPMAEALARWGSAVSPRGVSTVRLLNDIGLTRPGVQFVHCCDLDSADIHVIAAHGVTVAHCPRSNRRLQCPPAPVRELLDAGVAVGLGMDSAASGGPIDMFAEMRAALDTSCFRGKPVTPEETWRMATCMGAFSIGISNWEIEIGSRVPLLRLDAPDACCIDDLIGMGTPEQVERLEWNDEGS